MLEAFATGIGCGVGAACGWWLIIGVRFTIYRAGFGDVRLWRGWKRLWRALRL